MKSGINKVTFKSLNVNLAGLLFTPENFDENKTYPTIVFSGPFNQIKEQMGSEYGKVFAEMGYVFLVFDHVGYGDSEGEIRNFENGEWKKEGIRDAISYLRTLAFVDKGKLFGIGGCASGGYMPLVAVTDKRLKAIATVSGMNNNTLAYFGSMSKEQMIQTLTFANEARQRMYETGEVETIDALGYEGIDPESLPEGAAREGYDYYMTERAGSARFPNYSHRSLANILEYAPLLDATLYAEYIYMPFIGVVGEHADTAIMTKNFYEAAKEPKAFVEVEGATHVSLYDNQDHIKVAVKKIDEFFKEQVK